MSTHAPNLTNNPVSASRNATAGAVSAQFTMKDFIRVVRNRLILITVITLLIALGSTALCFFLKRTVPLYTAENALTCEMPQGSLLSPEMLLPRQDVIQLNSATYAAELTSEGFLTKILDIAKVTDTDWYRAIPKRKSYYKELLKNFSARPVRNTKYIRVTMTAGNPKDAQTILDTIIDTFLQDKGLTQRQSLTNDKKALNDKLAQFNSEIRAKEERVAALGSQAVAGWRPGQSGGTMISEDISRYNESIMLLNAEINSLRGELGRMEAGATTENPGIQVSSKVLAAVEQDPLILGLRNQITNLVQQRNRLLERLGEQHREVRDYQALIAIANQQLEEQRSNLIDQYARMEYGNLQDQLVTYQSQLSEITDKYDRAIATQRTLDENARKYMDLKDELVRLYKQVDLYTQSIAEIETKIGNSESVTVKRIGPTVLPNQISFPKLAIFIPGGLILGLLAGLGLAFLLEIVDDTVKSPSDILRYLNAPLLGMIPQHESEGKTHDLVEKIVITHPNALISEFYRQVRTNLVFSAPPDEMKTLLITSASGGCGKTTSAVNLACSLAGDNKKVLLIDCNFRRPMLSKLFPTEKSKQGLSNVLVNQIGATEAVCKSNIKNLDILYSGPLPPSPADLVSSPQMKNILQDLRAEYDFIILDGPPALIVEDARIIASIVDGTVVVINAETTARGMAQRLLRELRTVNARLLGVLLNSVKVRKGGYFAQTYESYYDYIATEPAVMGILNPSQKTGPE